MNSLVVTCLADFGETTTTDLCADSIFRGLADVSRQLVTPIGRPSRWARMDPGQLAREEHGMRARFRESGAAYVADAKTLSTADWAIAAHEIGLPGGLLAWTRSPLVALWFACQGGPAVAGAVYVQKLSRLGRAGREADPLAVRRVSTLLPGCPLAAIAVGSASPTVCTVHPGPRAAYRSDSLLSLRVSGKLKRELKLRLARLGIDAAAVTPSLAGVARNTVA